MHSSFEWDEEKNKINIEKHKVNFYEAQKAFLDINRIILKFRNNYIRIFGAGYWRKGKRIYEQENKIY
ncbi:BrnT family toxin [Rickettsia endosymbiont of Polydrusus tereticollis]|uniref:BrnT family toxin n=1 Tax=Rickettsia endosymbiont of Polydrusus tereticollis TaxID=3066251 RepID=UPI0031334129